MRILFLHPNFPAQFRRLATALAADPRNQVVFGTNREEGELPGVHKVLYGPSRQAHAEVHPYLGGFENAVLQGQAVYRLVNRLKEFGFVPDLVYGHSGWGPTLYIKDALPDARLVCYFEWFYRAHGSDVDFDLSDPASPDTLAQLRIKNAPILMDPLPPAIWASRPPSGSTRSFRPLCDRRSRFCTMGWIRITSAPGGVVWRCPGWAWIFRRWRSWSPTSPGAWGMQNKIRTASGSLRLQFSSGSIPIARSRAARRSARCRSCSARCCCCSVSRF
ncbi:gll3846 [Gloeobacter violaceus PCC 7421]|uniref:Gll3846 protein n=1 Tax=Gloeobacter violaceus (strain ATCC 29082 / PCC 7421) TaxID=251221 RepID=Q7NEN3_GLOVI|nr:gll3846 [Gloeobacter violaceus PCC 7421]